MDENKSIENKIESKIDFADIEATETDVNLSDDNHYSQGYALCLIARELRMLRHLTAERNELLRESIAVTREGNESHAAGQVGIVKALDHETVALNRYSDSTDRLTSVMEKTK